MNTGDWYTLKTTDEIITGTIVEVTNSFFRIRQGDRTRAFNVSHIVSLNPVPKHVAVNMLSEPQNAPSEALVA